MTEELLSPPVLFANLLLFLMPANKLPYCQLAVFFFVLFFFRFPGKLSVLTTKLCTPTIDFYRLPPYYDTLPLQMVPVL